MNRDTLQAMARVIAANISLRTPERSMTKDLAAVFLAGRSLTWGRRIHAETLHAALQRLDPRDYTARRDQLDPNSAVIFDETIALSYYQQNRYRLEGDR